MSYRELDVYKIAFSAAMRIFQLTERLPSREKYMLAEQICRSSRSVCSNIAEAWRKRPYPAHFKSKLSDAEAEAEETRVWLEFAVACGYLEHVEMEKLDESYDHVLRKLVVMSRNPEHWRP